MNVNATNLVIMTVPEFGKSEIMNKGGRCVFFLRPKIWLVRLCIGACDLGFKNFVQSPAQTLSSSIFGLRNDENTKNRILSGSDGIFYRNQCKLDATNCELGAEIRASEISKCQHSEPSKPKPARFTEIKTEMNDSQLIIEPPINDLTNPKSSRLVFTMKIMSAKLCLQKMLQLRLSIWC